MRTVAKQLIDDLHIERRAHSHIWSWLHLPCWDAWRMSSETDADTSSLCIFDAAARVNAMCRSDAALVTSRAAALCMCDWPRRQRRSSVAIDESEQQRESQALAEYDSERVGRNAAQGNRIQHALPTVNCSDLATFVFALLS